MTKSSGAEALMTLDEAIEHCREKESCSLCGQEHKQLREWLEDYKRLLQGKSSKFEDFTDDGQAEYESVLDEQYQDTGININDLV